MRGAVLAALHPSLHEFQPYVGPVAQRYHVIVRGALIRWICHCTAGVGAANDQQQLQGGLSRRGGVTSTVKPATVRTI